jgi:hypothetical protein
MTKSPRRLRDVRGDIDWPEDLQAAMDKVLATDQHTRYDDALMFAADFYAGVSQLPMTPAAEEYYNLLTQRAVTLVAGLIDAGQGLPSIETPAQPMPRREVHVPQLADTAVLPASLAAGIKAEAAAATAESTVTGSDEGIGTPSGAGVAFPTPAATPTSPRRRGPLLLAGPPPWRSWRSPSRSQAATPRRPRQQQRTAQQESPLEHPTGCLAPAPAVVGFGWRHAW